VSRYLVQLARQTRSTLRPPSSLRLAPRAPAIVEEIHEERLVGPAPAAWEPARTASPALEQAPARARLPEKFTTPISPPPLRTLPTAPPVEDRHFQPARELKADAPPVLTPKPVSPKATEAARIERRETWNGSASPITERRFAPASPERPLSRPVSAKAEPRPPIPSQASREIYREILETTVHSESFVADDIRPAPKEPRRIAEYAIPEPVRTWLRPAPERPAPIPARAQSPAPASQPAPRRNLPPAIDVSIGKIEVTIESEPQPPLRAVRRAEPRAAAPPRPAPAAGLLARQYLDR